MSARHSIIFLTYNKPDLIESRLDEAGQFLGHRQDVEVLVYDNGSEDRGVRLALATRVHLANIPIIMYHGEKNVGFGPGFNRAILAATGEIIHLFSDDVQIYGDFIEALGEFSPREVVCHQIISHEAGWNQFGDFHFPYPSGYYLALYKTSWQILGGFDEQFKPYDMEDVDLGMRVFKSDDFALAERAGLPIRHLTASTIGFGADRYDHTCAMRALFAKKWGLENKPERP